MTARELGKLVTVNVLFYKYGDGPAEFVDLNKPCRVEDVPDEILDMEVGFIHPRGRDLLDVLVVDAPKLEKLPFSDEPEVEQ